MRKLKNEILLKLKKNKNVRCRYREKKIIHEKLLL